MCIYIHTSLSTYLRPEFCLISAAGGVGGLRGDVTGVGSTSDALKDPSADLGNLSADFGASQPLPLLPDLYMQRSTKTPPSMHLTELVASTNELSLLARSLPNTRLNLC